MLVLVTGASRGLGNATSSRLLGLGIDVVGTCRNPEKLASLIPKFLDSVELAPGVGKRGEFHLLRHALDERANPAELVRSIQAVRPDARFDAVVHNAGGPGGIAVNFLATKRLNDALLPLLKANGRVVFLTSGQGQVFGNDMYCSLWDKTSALPYIQARTSPLRANAVAPLVRLAASVIPGPVLHCIPILKRWCASEIVLNATFALCSDVPSYRAKFEQWFPDYRKRSAWHQAETATVDDLVKAASRTRRALDSVFRWPFQDTSIGYCLGKAFLNAYVRKLSADPDLTARGVQVFALDPGSCRTGTNRWGFSPAAHGCVGALALALGPRFATEALPSKPANPDQPGPPAGIAHAATPSTPAAPSGSVLVWRGTWCGEHTVPGALFQNNLIQMHI